MTGTVPMGTPTEVTQDRFKGVFPNVTRPWDRVRSGSCVGTPCDPSANRIGLGSERRTWYAEEQAWETDLICFKQAMHITQAAEQIEYFISDILRPATDTIASYFLRKRHLQWAGRHWQANSTMDQFTFEWTLSGSDEIFLDCSVAPDNVFKLTPQMLQRRVVPLMSVGYDGKNPFKETMGYIELVTDLQTMWELDKLGGQQGVGGVPGIANNWRFTQWTAANEYWRYGFTGSLGNYLCRPDMQNLRFNYVGQSGAAAQNAANVFRYQLILPYANTVTSGAGGEPGIGREFNEDFENAQYQISQIHHKSGMQLMTLDARPLTPETQFMHPSFGGKWQWLQHDLGVDSQNRVINNQWGYKGKFGVWFEYYIRPMHTEFMEAIMHKREPACVIEIDTCNPSPGYPTQTYDSSNDGCPNTEQVISITPVLSDATGTYEVLASTVLCNGSDVDNGALTGSTTLVALLAQINADSNLAALGTWAIVASDITLTGTSCTDLDFPFLG